MSSHAHFLLLWALHCGTITSRRVFGSAPADFLWIGCVCLSAPASLEMSCGSGKLSNSVRQLAQCVTAASEQFTDCRSDAQLEKHRWIWSFWLQTITPFFFLIINSALSLNSLFHFSFSYWSVSSCSEWGALEAALPSLVPNRPATNDIPSFSLWKDLIWILSPSLGNTICAFSILFFG